MTIYELNRTELLSVMRNYVEAFEDLETAIKRRTYAEKNTKKEFANIVILLLRFASFMWIFPLFGVSFFGLGELTISLLGETPLTIALGIASSLLVVIGYIFLRKKILKLIEKKFSATKKDYDFLEQCIENEKLCQGEVDRMYIGYSMPKVLSTTIPVKWIYEHLTTHNVSLDTAIKSYYNYLDREAERSHQAYLEYTKQKEREAIQRDNDRVVAELRRQNELLQRNNDLAYYRNMNSK